MPILSQVKLDQRLGDKEFAAQFARYQDALSWLGRRAQESKRPVVAVFEGWHAAGKDDAIDCLIRSLDPRDFVVHPIGRPELEDAARHYLYRFWRLLPRPGQLVAFERSWYGRVLEGRVEAERDDVWRRAYREINQFERQLVDFGMILLKFWLHIDADEQLRRLQAREELEEPPPGLADAWRAREKRSAYEEAVEEMLLKTSTLAAPWTIVEANDPHWAQIKVLRTTVERLSHALDVELEDDLPAPRSGKGQGGKKKRVAPSDAAPDQTAEDPPKEETMANKDKKQDKKDKKKKKEKKEEKKV